MLFFWYSTYRIERTHTNHYLIDEVFEEWDEVYKKGQLTLWVLLSLYDGEKYSQEIANFMTYATNGHLSVKEQSLYRALRRYKSLGIVNIVKKPSPNSGPDRNYFSLTTNGEELLRLFVKAHITPLQSTITKQLLDKLQKGTS